MNRVSTCMATSPRENCRLRHWKPNQLGEKIRTYYQNLYNYHQQQKQEGENTRKVTKDHLLDIEFHLRGRGKVGHLSTEHFWSQLKGRLRFPMGRGQLEWKLGRFRRRQKMQLRDGTSTLDFAVTRGDKLGRGLEGIVGKKSFMMTKNNLFSHFKGYFRAFSSNFSIHHNNSNFSIWDK